jgi:alpha-D-ribose 1-methylphosphonate 5-triphosphate synthase subunit PhnG
MTTHATPDQPFRTASDPLLASWPRALILSTLAKADAAELGTAIATHWPDIAFSEPKPAETGLVMIRGRMGGDGAAFNLGEATMARAVIDLPTGERGYGQCLGRDVGKARLAALLDALSQRKDDALLVVEKVLEPVATRLAREKAQTIGRTAATKVDFFTLVRGED